MVQDRLTDREKQVAAHLTSGLRVVGVAKQLSLSENTVRNHLKRALSKLGVHSQSELIDLLRRNPEIVSPHHVVAGLSTGTDQDLIEELAQVDRSVELRIERSASTGTGLERMQNIIRAVLPLDETRRHEWRVRLAAHVVGPRQREVRNASSDIYRRWESKPLQRITDFQARGWVRQDLEAEEVRRRLAAAVYGAAMALLANDSPEEEAHQLAEIDRLLAEIAAQDGGDG